MTLCGACGLYARNAKNADPELRRRACPRFRVVHRGCCALQECSRVDARGAVRCEFERWRATARAPAAPVESDVGLMKGKGLFGPPLRGSRVP